MSNLMLDIRLKKFLLALPEYQRRIQLFLRFLNFTFYTFLNRICIFYQGRKWR